MVIALILVNIVPRSISYCTRKFVQYDILLGTIFTNINAIILYYTMSMGSLIFMDVCTRS